MLLHFQITLQVKYEEVFIRKNRNSVPSCYSSDQIACWAP
jgi:hypothetical protein